jgi:hypothetical protein
MARQGAVVGIALFSNFFKNPHRIFRIKRGTLVAPGKPTETGLGTIRSKRLADLNGLDARTAPYHPAGNATGNRPPARAAPPPVDADEHKQPGQQELFVRPRPGAAARKLFATIERIGVMEAGSEH